MKRFLLISLVIVPILCFSQGNTNNKKINWISLEKAEKYASKYNKNILIFFYKKKCPYCDKMKKETLSDPDIITLINTNFYPVKIDSRTKDTISYSGKKYTNQQPIEHGYTWRHDFYAEVASFTRNGTSQSTTPTIVLFNNKFQKIKSFPGYLVKQLLIRNLKPYVIK